MVGATNPAAAPTCQSDEQQYSGGGFPVSVIYTKHFICQFPSSLNQRCMKTTTAQGRSGEKREIGAVKVAAGR